MAARPRTVISRLVVIVWDIQNFFAAAAVKEWRKSACFRFGVATLYVVGVGLV